MDKQKIEGLVYAALAQSLKDRTPGEIRLKATLGALGLSEADILELKTRLYKALSGKRRLSFSKFERSLNVTPSSTVRSVVYRLAKAFPSKSSVARRTTAARMNTKHVEAAVRTVLSEKTPTYTFSQIKPAMILGKDLNLDEATIAEVKLNLYKTLGDRNSNFIDFVSALDVGNKSTVKDVIEKTLGALPGNDLPGNDPTPIKGIF